MAYLRANRRARRGHWPLLVQGRLLAWLADS
jgi:hypothetical protein